MFRSRWVTGFDQSTPEIWHSFEPALRLASRFLTEDYCLLWFSHLTFGERVGHSHPFPGTYVHPTSYSNSRSAIKQVKANLQELGEIVTFMFAPRGYPCNFYGMTTVHKSMFPWFYRYHPQDWPTAHDKYHSAHYHHARPSITMSADFQKYFKTHYSVSSLSERYKAWFLFAVTIVHELGHAYEFWLHNTQLGPEEPFCSHFDKNAELGFSWETSVVGRITNPLNHTIAHGVGQLFSIKIEEYKNSSEREHALKLLHGRTGALYTMVNPTSHRFRSWPILDPDQFRGERFLFTNNVRKGIKFIARIQAIPLVWVVNWFQEAAWVGRQQIWTRKKRHITPPIGQSFTIVYENYGTGAQVQRQLNLNFPADALIHQQQWALRLQAEHRP